MMGKLPLGKKTLEQAVHSRNGMNRGFLIFFDKTYNLYFSPIFKPAFLHKKYSPAPNSKSCR